MGQSDWAGTGVEQLQQQSGAAGLEDDGEWSGFELSGLDWSGHNEDSRCIEEMQRVLGGVGGGEGSEACLARALCCASQEFRNNGGGEWCARATERPAKL
jgi:hypothetical protein